MSSATTTVLSRQSLAQVLKKRDRPPRSAGRVLWPADGAVSGRDRGCPPATALDSGMGARHRTDRRRPAVFGGAEAGHAPPSSADHPAGAAGPGTRRRYCPPEVMVLHA